MKNPTQELFHQMQQAACRRIQGNRTLSHGGLYIPHCYDEIAPDSLSWWDDFGFSLNGRWVAVWWEHPRMKYKDQIKERAREQATYPKTRRAGSLFEGATKNYRKVGASRKKIVSYTCPPLSDDLLAYFNEVNAIETSLSTAGIDLEVPASFGVTRHNWARGVSLVVPIEVRNETELADVAALARRLLTRQTTLAQEFPGYRYTRESWLTDVPRMNLHLESQ